MTSAPANWIQLIAQLHRPHLLQTAEWAQAKQPFGWTAHYRTWEGPNGRLDAAAQILQRSVRIPGLGKQHSMLYVPKGPVLREWQDAELRSRVLADLGAVARQVGAFFIKVD